MEEPEAYTVVPIGWVRSTLVRRSDAPKQGNEGAPDARLEVLPAFAPALQGIEVGQDAIVLTWLHQARRDVLQVHPRNDESRPLAGTFATRSPDRPNPVGLHRVTVVRVDKPCWLHVRGLEAIDGTPVIDIKPVQEDCVDW